jgi:hypothetical protein
MCVIHCDRLAAINICRGLGILICIFIADYTRNETIRLFSIFGIVTMVLSWLCLDTSRLRRIREERRRQRDNDRDTVMLEILNRNIQREALNIIRTRTTSYKLGKNDPHIGDECCICLDEFKNRSKVSRIECCHVFHKKCIEKWLLERAVCPLCKFDVFDDLDIIIDIEDNEEDEDEIE